MFIVTVLAVQVILIFRTLQVLFESRNRIIIIIIRHLHVYSAIMPLGCYRGAGGTPEDVPRSHMRTSEWRSRVWRLIRHNIGHTAKHRVWYGCQYVTFPVPTTGAKACLRPPTHLWLPTAAIRHASWDRRQALTTCCNRRQVAAVSGETAGVYNNSRESTDFT